MEDTAQAGPISIIKNPEIQFAAALICVLMMMFIPLPAFLLDFLLSLSITLGFLIILTAIYIKEPLDFSTFPTFLLLATLTRLSLNVATTRNILLDGANGDVSQVVVAFGNFVVGGNYFVGFVIFLILVIINFLVITKGAGRVAEVGARFTLDAMPGKQMSIDADLNAGIIDREEAKTRRRKIEAEADFYGSMDGASKFVRGDAIAGIIITIINIIVGLIVGVVQYNMEFSQAAQIFTLLTVGDGLVSQIPAIIISVAAGIVVTRASGSSGLSNELSDQIFLNPKALYICSTLLFLLALTPGLPKFPLFMLSASFFAFARISTNEIQKRKIEKVKISEEKSKGAKNKTKTIESLLHVDILSLEVGVGLIPLVDSDQNGEVLERIVSARKQFAQDLGIIVPMVMVRDNIQLKPGEYQILLKGNVVSTGSLLVDHELAMTPEDNFDPIEGVKTKEPAYGLDALWIKPSQKDEASFRGYTVVNCSTVIVTHLTKIIQDHAHELLGRQEAQNLIDGLKETYPKVVDEVFSKDEVNLGLVVKILQNLLKEGVSIRDLLSIFETIADNVSQFHHHEILTTFVRKSLGRTIIKKFTVNNKLSVISLDRGVEDLLISNLQRNEDGSTALKIDPKIAKELLHHIAESVTIFDQSGGYPLLVCGAQIRWDLKKLIDRFVPGLSVIAFDEIPDSIRTENLRTITI